MHDAKQVGRVVGAGASMLVLLAFAGSARADEVRLNNGQTFQGIVRQEPGKVRIDTGAGILSFPVDQVQQITPGPSAQAQYAERVAALGPRPSADQTFALALWARDQGLTSSVNPLLRRTIEIDADHEQAHRLLGELRDKGRWVSRAERDRREGRQSTKAQAQEKPARKKRPTHPEPEISPGYVYFGIPPSAPTRGSQNHGGYGVAYPVFHGVVIGP